MKVYNRATGATKPLAVTSTSPTGLTAGDLTYSTSSCDTTAGPWLTDEGTAHSQWELFAKEGSTKAFCLRLKDNHQLYAALAGYVGLRYFTTESEATLHNDNSDISSSQSKETGNGSLTFYMRDSVVVNITFKVYDDNGNFLYEAKGNQTPSAAPFLAGSAARDFTTIEGYYSDSSLTTPLTAITTSTDTVYVKTQQGTLPFTVSDPTTGEWHWYYLHIRLSSDATTTKQYVTAFGPAPYREVADANPYEPQALWAFVGNVADGFKVYNRWYGSAYTLTNPYGDIYADEASDANHERYKGPVLTKGGTTKWNLIQYKSGNITLFGLTDIEHPNMSINVHTSHRDIGFYYWDAKKAINSRMMVEPLLEYSQSSDATLSNTALTQLKKVVGKLQEHQGCVFSFKNSVAVPDTATATAEQLETFVTDTANYVRPESTPYIRIVQGGKSINVAPSSFVKATSTVATTPRLDTADESDAGYVFKLDYDTTNDRYRLRSQGVWMHCTTTQWASESTEPTDELAVTPLGQAQAALATTETTEYPYLHMMKASGDTLANGTGDETATGWYLEPATSVTATAGKISYDGDAYKGYSFASLCYDFPVKVNGGTAYYCSSRSDDTDVFTAAPDNEVPAGVPFIYVDPDGGTTPTITILDNDVTGLNADTEFRGILLKTQYNDSDFLYASTLAFGYKADTAYWLATDNDGKTSVGFRKPSNTSTFGPNKGCIYVGSASAKAALRILFTNTATGITEVSSEAKADGGYYDLQGRRVTSPSHGVYIHQGKKIVIR